MKYFLLGLFLVFLPLQFSFLYLKDPLGLLGAIAGIQNQQSADVDVFAFIGDHHFSLYGYTSPKALVTFEGMGVFDQTTADDKGYFQFNNRFSPFSQREACLSSKDQFGRLSSPLCLPPFPVNYNVSIGPVIMPPTLSLDKQDYFIGDEVILSGQAVPNTEVKLSVFGKDKDSRGLIADFHGLVRPVEAFTFPELVAQSDSKGNFSINLPSSNPEKFRLFAQTDFEKSVSPNSVKLNLEILPVWMIIIKFFLFLFYLIRPRLLEITIIVEIIYIIYVIKSHFQKKAIILYRSRLPAVKAKIPFLSK